MDNLEEAKTMPMYCWKIGEQNATLLFLNVSFLQDRWCRKFDDVTWKSKIWFSRTKQKRSSPLFHYFMFIG